MKIGIPKEIKAFENRVSITPGGVQSLIQYGHSVFIEDNAGLGSGFTNDEYRLAGASIVETKEVWENADMILKVKEPLNEEYKYFREGLILFTYLHLAANESLTKELIRKKVTAIAYETISDKGTLPLLTPMSEVAGRMAIQIGSNLLEKINGGKGILLGGVPGVLPANVVIIGGGVVGTNAAKIAVGMGADVTIIDNNANRLRQIDEIYNGRLKTVMSNPFNIAKSVEKADLLIGSVLIPGAKAPKLVSKDMVKSMNQGSVILDVAVDQGGSIETIDRTTTHAEPTYEKHGVIHYAVPNMPGAVPRTSTLALTNVTLPYVLKIANNKDCLWLDSNMASGINTYQGDITFEAVSKAFNLPYTQLKI